MTILDEINAKKRLEVANAKQLVSIKQLEKSDFFSRTCFSATQSILSKSGIIAEHKRQSPSKGVINGNVTLNDVVVGYESAGASCVSILTDYNYFGGTCSDVIEARSLLSIPILRKEFIVDEYQIIEAKSIGADFILLIAASLTKKEIKQFAQTAKSLGMQILMEVHTKEELDKCCPQLDIIGVNNRNLKDFAVDVQISKKLFEKIPTDFIPISESGISSIQTVKELQHIGYKGFLMGENFMKEENPGNACAEFISKL